MASEATEWATGIASAQDDDVVIRGYRLSELVGSITLTGGIFLVWQGRLPSQKELEVLDALFVAVLEHGISPSATISRTLASAGVPVQAAIAGGILSIGDVHGGAGEQLAHALSTVAADPAVPTRQPSSTVSPTLASAFRATVIPNIQTEIHVRSLWCGMRASGLLRGDTRTSRWLLRTSCHDDGGGHCQ